MIGPGLAAVRPERRGGGGVVGGASPAFEDDFEAYAVGSIISAGVFWKQGDGTTAAHRPVISTTRAYSGTKSLRFKFGPDEAGSDSRSQQGFDLLSPVPELWLGYRMWIDANYTHRVDEGTNNNKFFGNIYNDEDGVNSVLFDAEVHPNSEESGGSALYPQYRNAAGSATYINEAASENWTQDVISADGIVPTGEWVWIRKHIKTSSNKTAEDGVFELWANATKFFRYVGLEWHPTASSLYDAETCTVTTGYLFGAANSGFLDETFIYVDDFEYYTSNPGW